MLNKVPCSNTDYESDEETDVVNTRLDMCVSDEAFFIKLDCGDGISTATSRVYTWKQIVQLLIIDNPDIFGDIDEPLHAVYPSALTRLGYHVPGWNE